MKERDFRKLNKDEPFLRGRAVFYVMSLVMMIFGLAFLVTAIILSDGFTENLDIIVIALLFFTSGLIGWHKRHTDGKNLLLNFILSIITTFLGFISSLKSLGLVMDKLHLANELWLIIVSIIFGILVPFLQLMSIMIMRNPVHYDSDDYKDVVKPDQDQIISKRRAEIRKLLAKKPVPENPRTWYLYRKTFKYALMRVLFYLLGAIIISLATLIGNILCRIWHFDGDAQSMILSLCATAGSLGYFAVTKIARVTFRDPQIAIVTYAIKYGKLPDRKHKDIKGMIKNRFRIRGMATILIETLDILINRKMLKKKPELLNEAELAYLNDLYSFIGYFLAGFVPFVGQCCLSWWMSHDTPILKGLCDGLANIVANRKKLIRQFLLVFFMFIILIAFLALAIWYFSPESNSTHFLPEQIEKIIRALILAAVSSFKFILWPLIQPFGMIAVLSVYVKESEKNPVESKLYYKLINKIRSRVHLPEIVKYNIQ